MLKTSIQPRDRFLIGLLGAYIAFGMACFIDSDDDNNSNNNPSNPNNNPNTSNNGTINIGEDISKETTWKGLVKVNKDVSLRNGAALTVEAGTEIVMCADCTLDLAYFNDSTTFNFNGTAEKPIIIRGAQPVEGYWKGVRVGENATSLSALKHVHIKHAGGEQTPSLELERDILVEGLSIEASAFDALHATSFKEGSTGLTVKTTKGYAAVLKDVQGLLSFPANEELAADKPEVVLDFTNLEGTGTIRALSLPYYVPKSLRLIKDSDITITEGATFRVGVDQGLAFAYFNDAATLKVQGSAAKPVVFEGKDPSPGSWEGIEFNENLRSASVLEHMIVRHGGASDGSKAGIINYSQALFKNVTVEQTKGYGVILKSEARFKEGSTALTIKDSSVRPIQVETEALLTLPPESDFSQNTDARIELIGGNIEGTGTIRNFDVPYYVNASLALRTDADITVEPGARFEIAADQDLSFGYFNDPVAFKIEGTADKPIVFTGVDESAGSWKGFYVSTQAKSSSTLKHVHFSYGGLDDGANLFIDSPITVENCKFENSKGYGIKLDGEAAEKDYSGNGNTFSGNAKGDIEGFVGK